jgi:hypothetical protein
MATTMHKILYYLTSSLCVPQERTFIPTPRLLPENERETSEVCFEHAPGATLTRMERTKWAESSLSAGS